MPTPHSPTAGPVIVAGVHQELTPALKAYAHAKAERLFRHDQHILRVRITLEVDASREETSRFVAKGIVEIRGPDLVSREASDDAYKSIDLLTDKLDRMLRERSRFRRDRRNNRPATGEFADQLAPDPAGA